MGRSWVEFGIRAGFGYLDISSLPKTLRYFFEVFKIWTTTLMTHCKPLGPHPTFLPANKQTMKHTIISRYCHPMGSKLGVQTVAKNPPNNTAGSKKKDTLKFFWGFEGLQRSAHVPRGAKEPENCSATWGAPRGCALGIFRFLGTAGRVDALNLC